MECAAIFPSMRRYSIKSPKSMAVSPLRNNSMSTHPSEKMSIAGVNFVGGVDDGSDDDFEVLLLLINRSGAI